SKDESGFPARKKSARFRGRCRQGIRGAAMRPVGTIVFLSTALAASVAAAQTTRVFHLIQNETADQMFQIATLIRSTGGIQQIWANDLQRTVSVTGTSAELDMAAWYVK